MAVQALKNVSFEIEPASFVSFVGPSGSGKTTLLNLMKQMRNEFQTTFIFSTHDQKIVGKAEILFTLEDGEIKGM